MLNKIVTRTAQTARSFSTSSVRCGGHGGGGYPEVGSGLPFSIKNRYRLLVTFSIYFGTAAAFPFWVVKRAADKDA